MLKMWRVTIASVCSIAATEKLLSDSPWSLADAPATYIDAMCRGIVGFRLTIDSIQAQFKLSQNKTPENISGVISGLEQLNTSQATAMAIKIADQNNR